MEQLNSLSYSYVHDTIFRKLSDTCVKYRNVLPEITSIEQAIKSADAENYLQLTTIVFDILKTNAERSRVILEIFENVQKDFMHAQDAKFPAHEGKYYINSLGDNWQD